MNSTTRLHRNTTNWLRESQLASYVDAFTRYLTEREYASGTVGNYLACLAHFARWMIRCRLDIRGIVEANLEMKEKALARLQEPDTAMRRYHPPDAMMQFLRAL